MRLGIKDDSVDNLLGLRPWKSAPPEHWSFFNVQKIAASFADCSIGYRGLGGLRGC
jgi:hypothetical protein